MASQNVPQQSAVRRIITLDIETASLDPRDPEGAFDAKVGRILCVGILIDDGMNLTPAPICDADERKLLERFWAALRPDDVIVGHNVLAFDLMFIRQRSWILGVKPPIALNLKKYYTDQVVDLMELWSNWSSRCKGNGLDNIARALGFSGKSADGSCVAQWWANRDYDSILRYCMDDVRLTYQVYCRMHYREPLPETTLAPVAAPAMFTAPLNTPAPLPRPSIVPQREPVLVPARQPAVMAEPAADSRPVRVEGFAPPASARGTRQRRNKITYAEMGGALILVGGTYPLKDGLAALGGRCTKGKDDKWVWQVPVGQFNALAGLCARCGVQFIPAAA
jgi:hypothetical protein